MQMNNGFFCDLPNHTHDFNGESCRGKKQAKNPLTALLCTNMDGSKRPVLANGKLRPPRSFQDTVPAQPGQQESLETADLFSKWLHDPDTCTLKIKWKILLFVDNCTAHTATMQNV